MNRKNKNAANYFFLSGWIANFGVVPLFFKCFLRFWPTLAILFLRILFNFTPNDAMGKLLKRWSVRTANLQILNHNVKMLAAIALLLFCTLLGAQETSLVLATGEQTELSLPNLKTYSLGNRDVVSTKALGHDRWLIKGKKSGHSDLLVWSKTGEQRRFRIFVLAKNSELHLERLADILRSAGLEVELSGLLVTAQGTIQTLDNYALVHSLEKSNKDKLFFRATLSKNLRDELIAIVYEQLFTSGVESIHCESETIHIHCETPTLNDAQKSIQTQLEKRYAIQFSPLASTEAETNYVARLKIIQMEKLDGEEIGFGLNRLYSNVGDVFTSGVRSLITSNSIWLEQTKVDVSTLAEPEVILQLESPASLEIGANIPYVVQGKDGNHTEWQFAGLRVNLQLKKSGDRFSLSYSTEVTRPSEGQTVEGSKQRSSATLNLKDGLTLFQIGLKTTGSARSRIPILGQIPILGNLFASKSSQDNYKTITALIIIEEAPRGIATLSK